MVVARIGRAEARHRGERSAEDCLVGKAEVDDARTGELGNRCSRRQHAPLRVCPTPAGKIDVCYVGSRCVNQRVKEEGIGIGQAEAGANEDKEQEE